MTSHPMFSGSAALALALALCGGASAQIPGDAPGGAPQFRDATGVLQPGSGAAGTTGTNSGTWTPKPLRRDPAAARPSGVAGSAASAASAPAKASSRARVKPG